jgi:2-phosphoglycerate kinase
VYRPLVILLGGSDGTGKSTIGIELAKLLDISTQIGTDMIREVMRSCVSEKMLPVLHTSAILAADLAPVHYKYPEIYGFIEQARQMTGAIESIIRRAIVEQRDVIIDGVHLLPGIIQADKAKVRLHHFIIIVSDSEEHKLRILGQGEHRSRYKITNFVRGRAFQQYLTEQAIGNGCHVVQNRELRETVQLIAGIVREYDDEANSR